ncbi:hypothetical protein [Roseobacter litoralis]|nr:hypothetical protein [Roseobacter litoralis]
MTATYKNRRTSLCPHGRVIRWSVADRTPPPNQHFLVQLEMRGNPRYRHLGFGCLDDVPVPDVNARTGARQVHYFYVVEMGAQHTDNI